VNNKKNNSKLVATVVLTVVMFAGMYVSTSSQVSYASILHAEDSDCAIFCPNLEFQLDNSVSQSNNCGNSQSNTGDVFVPLNPIGNESDASKQVDCNNTGPIR
jgi:hypothetical protein